MQEFGLLKSYSKRKFTASFKSDPELWSSFKETCKIRPQGEPMYGDVHGRALLTLYPSPMDRLKRGVSVCHVLEALMQAWIEAQKVEATLLKPVHIELHMEHVVQRPRRVSRSTKPWELAKSKTWPPSCQHAKDFIRSTKEVGCLELRDWVPLEKCWRCYLAKEG